METFLFPVVSKKENLIIVMFFWGAAWAEDWGHGELVVAGNSISPRSFVFLHFAHQRQPRPCPIPASDLPSCLLQCKIHHPVFKTVPQANWPNSAGFTPPRARPMT